MAFQAGVGTWFAAHLIAEMPVGGRFGLGATALPLELQFETGLGLDDIRLLLSDGGTIFVQCKTRPGLTRTPASPFGETIAQLVALVVALRPEADGRLDPARSAAVLAVARDAPGSLDNLERACRAFDVGGQWSNVKARLSSEEGEALAVFEMHARAAWQERSGAAVSDADLVALARFFHISRFDVKAGGQDWRDASRTVGGRVYGGEEAGEAPTATLQNVVRGLMRNGAPADRAGLLQTLRVTGREDVRAPRFERDIARLRALTGTELVRLRRHALLPIAGGVPLPRDCLGALELAIGGGSLLVIGEPGAGKTGVLVACAEHAVRRGAPVVFISVDRRTGVATRDDLRLELGLSQPLVDVLAAWPGRQPGTLVIDALDASRGGPSEGVFADLIEEATQALGGQWSVVASVRTFDLKNGRRFREAVRGAPPSLDHAEPGLEQVRHFRVPVLSAGELAEAARLAPRLGSLVATAPTALKGLLSNIFNLSLAAELVGGGVAPDSIRDITTQSDLIDCYEDERLPTHRLKAAVTNVAAVMAERRRLAVRKVDVAHEALDDALKTGVLAEAGDRVSFAHHVLFDHVAGRFHLDWTDVHRLKAQLTGDFTVGLLLGPALRFAMERVWREDAAGRPATWSLVASVAAEQGFDPVVASVALRTAAERVVDADDVEGLRALLGAPSRPDAMGASLSRLTRFVGMGDAENVRLAPGAATAWATVAVEAIKTGARPFADGTRFLLWTLSEKADFGDATFAAAFGRAARGLLAFAWATHPEIPSLAADAIRFVAKTFGADPIASRALLEQILYEPRFSRHAHEEVPGLAEGILAIAAADPAFAVDIYAALFGRPAPQDGETWLGGRPSRILAFKSYKRQEYEHARWHLSRALRDFLGTSPEFATRAVIAASLGAARADDGEGRPEVMVPVGADRVAVIDDALFLEDWREPRPGAGDDDLLGNFVTFLRACPVVTFRTVVETARSEITGASVWARLLGIGAERRGVADDLLWPVAAEPDFASIGGVSRGAVGYLAAAYPSSAVEARLAFETRALAPDLFQEECDRDWWRSLLARFLSVVPAHTLVTDAMRALRRELEQEGRLTGNRPFVRVESNWCEADDVIDRFLQERGADLDRPPNREVRAAARALDNLLKRTTEKPDPDGVEQLWNAVTATVAAIDATAAPLPHPEVAHTAWGAVSNAVGRIAESAAYDPSAVRHPDLDAMLGLLARLVRSTYPEPPGRGDHPMSWSNWDVRVYAASGLMALAPRFAEQCPGILDHLRTLLADPVPAVRLQVAGSLDTLWDVARGPMWELAEAAAQGETSPGVLAPFVGRTLHRLSGPEPDRCEGLVGVILDRRADAADGQDERRHRKPDEAIGGLAAQLWVGRGRGVARIWLERWLADIARSECYIVSFLATSRDALFFRFKPDATQEGAAMQTRAREALEAVVSGATATLERAEPLLRRDDGPGLGREAAEESYAAGKRLIELACEQLYFGSGAFRVREEGAEIGLTTDEAKRSFLAEYAPVLERVGQAGSARTVHHLIELYAYLAAARPGVVFDRVAAILAGPAARGGYHLESLGSGVLVSLLKRYLADYRPVFDDPVRRARLVDVLGLFSSVGWPEALKLLYDLPDALR